jgi:nucleoside-diphosphate-sugar epimerase
MSERLNETIATMGVSVTGVTGYIGSAVVLEFLEAGHDVVGLARSDASATALRTAGAEVHRRTLDVLRNGAAWADWVTHLASPYGVSDTRCGHSGLRAVEALGTRLEDSGAPFVVTSTTELSRSSDVS